MTRPQLRVRPVDDSLVRRLSAELRVRPATARCLFGRGVRDAGSAQAYLAPRLGGLRRPDGLAGFADAVDRIARAIVAGDRIGVFGDYDVDGVTTAALLGTFLRQVIAPGHPAPVVRVARRDLGYGFGETDAARFAADGCRLIVTGDCGTSDLAAIGAARAAGCEVVVVDHHTVPDAVEAHPASALVNPFRHDSTFPFRGLASVGLMFYLVAAVRTRLEEVGHFDGRRTAAGVQQIARPDVRELLDLVALGTIADLVPLQGENRILARFGLPALAPEVCARTRPGIAALLRLAGVDPARPVDERTVAWKLAPRLNAPGRLGDAEPALRLLMASADEAERCAAALEEANAARRELQDRVLEDALGMIETGGAEAQGGAIVVAGRGWPAGVVGIVAAKLVDLYRRPAFVIAVDPETGIGRGSARSPDGAGCNLYEALATCAPLMVRFGGHAAAAGLTVEEAQIDALREGLAAAVTAQGTAAPDATAVDCDAEVRIGEIDEALCAELGSLAPFGQQNGQPLLVARGVRVRSSRRVGDGSHLKLELEDPVHASSWRGAIGFGLGEHDPGLDARVDVAFAPVVSTWNGAKRVELELRSVVPC